MNGPVEARLSLARMIVQRMERMSADSTWTHIASGYRGSLLKFLDRLDLLPDPEGLAVDDMAVLDELIDRGLDLLAKAAREIGDPELLNFATQRRPPGDIPHA